MSRAICPTDAPTRLTVSTPKRGRSLSCSSSPGLTGYLHLSTNLNEDQAPPATPPPSKRRVSIGNTLNRKTHVPVLVRRENVQSTPSPVPPSIHAHSRCHGRSRSTNLLPEDIPGFDLPGYARPTERSRSRSRSSVGSISDGSLSKFGGPLTNNKGHSLVIQDSNRAREEGVTASTFKVTTNEIDPNVLKIDSKPSHRLEVRILATNSIEVVAIPIQVDFTTPPCSPSTRLWDNDVSTPDLSKIPALNISTPTELDSNPPSSGAGNLNPGETYQEAQKAPTPPQNAEEHLEAVTAFVEKRNISAFFQSGMEDAEGLLETLSSKAASLVKDLEEGKMDTVSDRSFITDAATVADVVKLSLYDQVIFCGE